MICICYYYNNYSNNHYYCHYWIKFHLSEEGMDDEL